MLRWIRTFGVLGFGAGIAAGAALQWSALGFGSAVPGVATASTGERYAFEDLDLLRAALYRIEESYVEPSRVDWEAMFVAALDEVEQTVPSVLFHRQSASVSATLGSVDVVVEVDRVGSRRALHESLVQVASLVRQHLPADALPEEPGAPDPFAVVEYAMVNGALGTLDPHSLLLPPEASRDMQVENQGEFGGLGVTLGEDDGDLRIDAVTPGAPAERAGVRAGDRIVRINGELTTNLRLDDAVSRLRGPVGEAVQLVLERGGRAEGVDVSVVRQIIPLARVEGTLLPGAVGYVRVEHFHALVESGLKDALAQLAREAPGGRLAGLVIDLRGNPGGLLDQAVAMSDLFLSEGVIVSTTDGRGRSHEETSAHPVATDVTAPLAVLVDAHSASASEIVAGALRNNERAVVIGERTFGKGSVQNLHDLPDGSKLKLTTQHYMTPGERSIQGVGIPADIALERVWFDPGEPAPGDEDIRLRDRTRVRRESDLDHALVQDSARQEESPYTVRVLERPREGRAPVPLDDDRAVQFARALLLAAPSARRAEILAAAGPVVARTLAAEEKAIRQAFDAEAGVDWTNGPAQPAGALPVALTIDLGPDGQLVAGVPEVVTVTATNTGSQPLYRLSALLGGAEPLRDRELWFGKLAPGESRRWTTRVTLPAGYPTEVGLVTASVYDSGRAPLGDVHLRLPVAGRALPALAWSARWAESGAGGDGQATPGEVVRLVVTVENRGTGDTAAPTLQLTSANGATVDLRNGEAAPGAIRALDGGVCAVTTAGVEAGAVVGDPASAPGRIARGKLPIYAEECVRRLAPGAQAEVWFDVALQAPPHFADGWRFTLTVADQSAFDHASVVRGDFWDAFAQRQDLVLPVGQPFAPVDPRTPPGIVITRAPGPVGEQGVVTVSGVVTDPTGIADVLVFLGDDKVFFAGAGQTPLRSVPFTADVALAPGENVITVLARDTDGLTQTRSVVTDYVDADRRAVAANLLEPAP